MKCPLCRSREHVEIGLHADGFSQDTRECGTCGAIWTYSGKVLKMIQLPTAVKSEGAQVFADFS